MVSAADREFLRELKEREPFTGLRGTAPDGQPTKAQIIGRGELAFVQVGPRALMVEVLAGHGVVFAPSIRRWDDGKKVSEDEREAVIEILSALMRELGFDEVQVVRR